MLREFLVWLFPPGDRLKLRLAVVVIAGSLRESLNRLNGPVSSRPIMPTEILDGTACCPKVESRRL